MTIKFYDTATGNEISRPAGFNVSFSMGTPSSGSYSGEGIQEYYPDGPETGWYEQYEGTYTIGNLLIEPPETGWKIDKIELDYLAWSVADSELVQQAYHYSRDMHTSNPSKEIATANGIWWDNRTGPLTLLHYDNTYSVSEDSESGYEQCYESHQSYTEARIFVTHEEYTVTVTVEGEGSAGCNKNPYEFGETVTLTATQTDEDYTFKQWRGGGRTVTSNPFSYRIGYEPNIGTYDGTTYSSILSWVAEFVYSGERYTIRAATQSQNYGGGSCTLYVNGSNYGTYAPNIQNDDTVMVSASPSYPTRQVCLYLVSTTGTRIDNPNLTNLSSMTNAITYTYNPTEDATWTALFNGYVTLTCYCEGEVIATRPAFKGLAYGVYEPLPIPTLPQGKKFVGWSTSSTATTPNITDATTASYSSGATTASIYAVLIDEEDSDSDSGGSSDGSSDDESSDDEWIEVSGDINSFTHTITGTPDGESDPDPIATCTGSYTGKYKRGTETVYGSVSFGFSDIAEGYEMTNLDIYAGGDKIGTYP